MFVTRDLKEMLAQQAELVNFEIKKGTGSHQERTFFLTGIVFAPPFENLAENNILNRIAYWNYRCPGPISFHFCGYSENSSERYDSRHKVGDGRTWYFSGESFAEFVKELERTTDWHYDGGCQMILVDVIYYRNEHAIGLSLASAINIKFEILEKNVDMNGISGFAEKIFSSTSGIDSQSITKKISDVFGLEIIKDTAVGIGWAMLPEKFRQSVSEGVKRSANFRVRNFEMTEMEYFKLKIKN